MYKSFEIKNFRCFSELKIQNFERINLIVGKNNVGKTALLEALLIHSGGYDPQMFVKVNEPRGIIEYIRDRYAPSQIIRYLLESSFYKFNTQIPIEMIGEIKKGNQTLKHKLTFKSISDKTEIEKLNLTTYSQQIKATDPLISGFEQIFELSYEEDGKKGKIYLLITQEGKTIPSSSLPPPHFKAVFVSTRARSTELEAAIFSKLKLEDKNKIEQVMKFLNIIEPKLEKIEILTIGGVPILCGDIGIGKLLPLSLMGEGISRLTSFLLYIGTVAGGLVLIDEIENGFHYSVLKRVWEAIATAAREFDVQVFATTHSLECIAASHQAFSKAENYDFKLYRLERIEGKIEAIEYDKQTLDSALKMDLEVR
jgi:AAA15 family ATPase/GTPase